MAARARAEKRISKAVWPTMYISSGFLRKAMRGRNAKFLLRD